MSVAAVKIIKQQLCESFKELCHETHLNHNFHCWMCALKSARKMQNMSAQQRSQRHFKVSYAEKQQCDSSLWDHEMTNQ